MTGQGPTHGKNAIYWAACLEWLVRRRAVNSSVKDLHEIVKWGTEFCKMGVKMNRITLKCSLFLNKANTGIAPAVTRAAGITHLRLCGHNMLQWQCGNLLSRTKSCPDMVTSLESSDEGLLIGASDLNRTFHGCIWRQERKMWRQKHDLMSG